MQLVNVHLRVIKKSDLKPLGPHLPVGWNFCAGAAEDLTDPRAIYGPASGRFFVVVANIPLKRVCFAVSTNSDPIIWHAYYRTYNNFPDYPGLGVSTNKLIITANNQIFSSSTLIINKQQVMNGHPSPQAVFFPADFTTHRQPAFSATPVGAAYEMGFREDLELGAGETLEVRKITGTPGVDAVTRKTRAIAMAIPNEHPADASQKDGNGIPVETNDNRVLNVVYSAGRLYGPTGHAWSWI